MLGEMVMGENLEGLSDWFVVLFLPDHAVDSQYLNRLKFVISIILDPLLNNI